MADVSRKDRDIRARKLLLARDLMEDDAESNDTITIAAALNAMIDFAGTEVSQARIEERERIADLELALNLALAWLIPLEPPDSRAVSNEFVAMAVIQSGGTDRLEECRDIIRTALADLAAKDGDHLIPVSDDGRG